MKRRGNPNWMRGLGEAEAYIPPIKCEFEQVVAHLKLLPEQYVSSLHLRAWAVKNWRQKFVPEALLEAWNLNEYGLPDD